MAGGVSHAHCSRRLSPLTGWRDPQGAQEGVHGVGGVDQAIRDAAEGGVDQGWLAAERRLERAARGNRWGRLPGGSAKARRRIVVPSAAASASSHGAATSPGSP
jgi:hypothetical protein